MYKLYAMWTAPDPAHVEAFEAHYREVHFPLAARLPGLESIAASLTSDTLGGGEPQHYRIAEMVFADKTAFTATLDSDEWTAVTQDSAAIFERWGVGFTVALGDVEVSEPLTS